MTAALWIIGIALLAGIAITAFVLLRGGAAAAVNVPGVGQGGISYSPADHHENVHESGE